MSEQDPRKEMNEALFNALITMLSTSAMQQMGLLVDPATKKAMVDLEGAQLTIDMLSMLKEKTQGNLGRSEERTLKDILASLQLNYVQVSQACPKPAAATKQTDTQEPAGEPPGGEPKETGKPGDKDTGEKKDPKFHKSYGG